jgi:AcrR family transcriptional regulator
MKIKRSKPEASSRRRKSAYHHGNLRDEAIAQAHAIVCAEGVAELGLRRVAAAVGVSAMALYRHFASKQGLLAAVAQAGFAELGRAIQKAAPLRQPPLDRLRNGGVAYVLFAVENRRLFELMFGGVGESLAEQGPVREAASVAFSTLVDCLADCSRAGLLKVDAVAAERAVWSAVHGYASLWNSVPELMRGTRAHVRANAHHMLTAILHGLAS